MEKPISNMQYTKRYLYSKEFITNKDKWYLPPNEVKKILNIIGYNTYHRKNGKIVYVKIDCTTWSDAKALYYYKEWRRDTKYLLGY